jgi:hypothetical protein
MVKKGVEIMNQKLRGQFVKVPSKEISSVVNKTVEIDFKSAMNELLGNPKLLKTLQKLSLV